MSLPKPNAEFVEDSDKEELDEEVARGVICNPVYAGFGPFPNLVDDKTWIEANKAAIEVDGAEQYLVNLLHLLRSSFKETEIQGNNISLSQKNFIKRLLRDPYGSFTYLFIYKYRNRCIILFLNQCILSSSLKTKYSQSSFLRGLHT